MLRVTINLHRQGGTGERLAHLDIINDGTGTKELGNYKVQLNKELPGPCWGGKTVFVKGHQRDQDVLVLLEKALEALNAN